MKLWILFVSEYNEIMCNTANELSGQKRFWRKRWRAKKNQRKERQEGCDGGRRNVAPELLLLIFSVWRLLCVGVSRWFKAPVKWRICKGLQATRRHASRSTTRQPPPLLTTLYWLPQFLSTPSDPSLSLFTISSLLPPSLPLTHSWLCDYRFFWHYTLLFRSFVIPMFWHASPFFSLLLISTLSVPISLSSPWSELREHDCNGTAKSLRYNF